MTAYGEPSSSFGQTPATLAPREPAAIDIGWTDPYVRRPYEMTAADRFGTWVVAHDLFENVCASPVVRSVDVFGIDAAPPVRIRDARPAPRPGVRWHTFERLLDVTREAPHLFVHQHMAFDGPGRIRAQLAAPLAVCCFATTISLSPQVYLNALLYGSSVDAIVVSSRAGRAAVDELLAIARESIAHKFSGRSVDEPQVRQIPFGIRPAAQLDRRLARHLLHLSPDDIVLLYFGRFSLESKADLEPLLTVLQRLRQSGHRVRLVLAGQDERLKYSRRLEEQARVRGVGDAVTIVPNVPLLMKQWFYAAADIFVSPVDNVQETFGIAILEAMAAGLPVVASDWSGYRDLVADGHNGFLVPTTWSADSLAIASCYQTDWNIGRVREFLAARTVVDVAALLQSVRTLVDSPSLREQFGRNGIERVRQSFTWDVVMRHLEALWSEQWDRLMARDRPVPTDANLDRVFREFPSRLVARTDRLIASADEPLELDDRSRAVRDDCHGPQGRTIAQLRSTWGDDVLDVVLRLWKRGYVESFERPPADAASASDVVTARWPTAF